MQTSVQQTSENRKAGFTITDVVISLFIFNLTMMMVMGFYTSSLKTLFVSEQKNQINFDMRKISGEMSQNGREADAFILYRSFAEEDRSSDTQRLLDGQAGDFLLLVYYSIDEKGGALNTQLIERVVGYYRWPSTVAPGETALKKFDITLDAPSDSTIEDLIPAVIGSADHKTLVERSRGLMQLGDGVSESDGAFFYNFWQRSVMVSGQFMHGNDAKIVTDAYNLTITPRG